MTRDENKTASIRELTANHFAMEVEGFLAKQKGGVMLPAGTVIRRETHIGFHPLDGVRVYRVEATIDGTT